MDCVNIKVMDFKKKVCITDTIGAHIMIQKQAVSYVVLLVCQPCDLFLMSSLESIGMQVSASGASSAS